MPLNPDASYTVATVIENLEETRSHHVEHIEIKNVEDPDELRLKPTVLLAYTDVCAAGSRALLGVDMGLQYFKVDIPELQGHSSSCVRHKKAEVFETEFLPLQVFNCKYEQFSIIVVNTYLSGKECHYVANRVMELCTQSNVKNIIFLSALKLDIREKRQTGLSIYENCFYTESRTKLPVLSQNTMIQDPFFATFMQMVHVERIPTNTLIIPGFKGFKGQANSDDQSKESISLFQETLNQITGLKFNNELSYQLVYSGATDEMTDLVSMIYG